MAQQPSDIVGYGAAAKGMVLLHYLLSAGPKFTFEYVVDDAPLKQNTFCPGTRIPVNPTGELTQHPCGKPLVIVVFSWNFWAEIRGRIVQAVRGSACKRFVWIVLPFPEQRIFALDLETQAEVEGLKNPYQVATFPLFPVNRRKVAMVSHFYNEKMPLPYFIQHHAPMFDGVTLINCGSTDRSREIIERLAPSNWLLVNSTNPNEFHFAKIDEEVEKAEAAYEGHWKIALTTTEFLVINGLRRFAATINSDATVIRYPSMLMIGNGTAAEHECWSKVYVAMWVVTRSSDVTAVPRLIADDADVGVTTRLRHLQYWPDHRIVLVECRIRQGKYPHSACAWELL